MVSEPAQVAVMPGSGAPGACDLCATSARSLVSTVWVEHARGGSVRFEACERCTAAIRRLAAATGGPARLVVAPEAGSAHAPAAAGGRETRATPGVAAGELIQERAERIEDGAGSSYVVRVFGRPRADGTWIGWVEFAPLAGGSILRTGAETTQSSRDQVTYWASGLEPLYFEGAFRRAREVGVSA